jgi:hypothetical protein
MTFNEHFQRQVDSANCECLPEDLRNGVLSDFDTMSQLGIDNDEDQNRFFLVRNHVPEIAHLIFKVKLNDSTARAIAAEVFRNREKAPIGTLLQLIEATDLALKKMVSGHIRPKIAYPQPGSISEFPKYDIGRWVAATREIYGLMSKGNDPIQAKKSVIGNWEAKEQMDYEQWLKFYKERTPEKYPKLAQDGLFLANLPIGVDSLRARHRSGKFPNPIGGMRDELPGMPQGDVNSARDKIEGQRRKLISRLNSAEKMLASMDGQLFAGDDQELMLKLLQDLKRRIQTANKLTSGSSLFVDQIYRAANLLKARGKDGAAGFFYKLAQLDPSGGMTPPPGIPGVEAPPSGEGDKNDTYQCLKEFFDNLERGVSDKDDTPEERRSERSHEVPPLPPAPAGVPAVEAPPPIAQPQPSAPQAAAAIEVADVIKIGRGYWHPRSKFAQEALSPSPPPPPPPDVPPSVVEAPPPVEETPEDNTEDVIDAALKGVSINDVVSRLEMLVSIYNKREIARQLAILDIMMDRLSLSSFFPALGEAMSKALESNQYIGSRLEGVLTKLKGSIEVPGASEWIEPKTVAMNPETTNIRNNLQQKKDEDEKRKEMRKEQDLAKMQGGAAGPDVGPAAVPVGESADLQKPVSTIERAPRIDVR